MYDVDVSWMCGRHFVNGFDVLWMCGGRFLAG